MADVLKSFAKPNLQPYKHQSADRYESAAANKAGSILPIWLAMQNQENIPVPYFDISEWQPKPGC